MREENTLLLLLLSLSLGRSGRLSKHDRIFFTLSGALLPTTSNENRWNNQFSRSLVSLGRELSSLSWRAFSFENRFMFPVLPSGAFGWTRWMSTVFGAQKFPSRHEEAIVNRKSTRTCREEQSIVYLHSLVINPLRQWILLIIREKSGCWWDLKLEKNDLCFHHFTQTIDSSEYKVDSDEAPQEGDYERVKDV